MSIHCILCYHVSPHWNSPLEPSARASNPWRVGSRNARLLGGWPTLPLATVSPGCRCPLYVYVYVNARRVGSRYARPLSGWPTLPLAAASPGCRCPLDEYVNARRVGSRYARLLGGWPA